MEHWKTIIERGNRHFAGGNWVEARECYLQALCWTKTVLQHWHDADEAVAMLAVSYHNLADLHRSVGQPKECAECLCCCHSQLLQMISDERLMPCLREAALRHSSRSHQELLTFVREHGTYPAVERLLYMGSQQMSVASPAATGVAVPRSVH